MDDDGGKSAAALPPPKCTTTTRNHRGGGGGIVILPSLGGSGRPRHVRNTTRHEDDAATTTTQTDDAGSSASAATRDWSSSSSSLATYSSSSMAASSFATTTSWSGAVPGAGQRMIALPSLGGSRRDQSRLEGGAQSTPPASLVVATQTNNKKKKEEGHVEQLTMMDCTPAPPLPSAVMDTVNNSAALTITTQSQSSIPKTTMTKSSNIELRKRLKLTDWTNRTYKKSSTRRLNNGSSKISSILQSNNNNEDESEDEDEDVIMAKRSYESILSSSSSTTANAAAAGKTIFDSIGISPIDNDAPSIKDMNLEYLLSWDPTIRPTTTAATTTAVGMEGVVVGNSSSGVEDTEDKMITTTTTATKKKKVTIVEDGSILLLKKEKSIIKNNSSSSSSSTVVAAIPKITRTDLAYMMNWNPFDNKVVVEEKVDDGGCSSSNGGGDAIVSQIRSTTTSAMTTINEAHEEGGTNTLLLVGDNGKNTSSQGRKDEESADMNNNNNNDALVNDKVEACSKQIGSNSSSVEAVSIYEDKTAATTTTSSSSNHESSSSSSNEEKEIMISSTTIDKTFLPLIENKNIIHVENIPYVKLGIIGKGGSCKVYRALSPDCTVVALKKVKLDGLNQCAIDGYANEIALLKRLRGNPAIIQLYSAEVDLNRKSILLVMELGEVDLNYVLRQQALSSSSSSKQKQGSSSSRGGGIVSSLNMNFIRLTWQQMLTAVHSIHEERIIHSDLKPANFLFVRGALKLIDFGIAKAIEREDTTNVYRETLSGTLSYMSPEAIMDTSTNVDGVRVNRCGRPSDIWSLGCILYQMVYGKTPFADYVGISQKVLAITNVNHEIHFPDGVDESSMDAMKLCLQRDPKLRPPIIGVNGLLNEHCFLHGKKKKITTDQR